MKKLSREEICQFASLCYRAEKYDLIIYYAKELIKENPVLTEREQQVFYEGYHYKITKEIESYAKLLEIEKREKKNKKKRSKYIIEIIEPVKKSIIELANDFDSQIDLLIAKAKTYAQMVYFVQWKMDFIRYKCQVLNKIDDEALIKEEIQKFDVQFAKAEDLAKNYMNEDDPVYLKLLLSKAIFVYEILDDPLTAKNIVFPCIGIIDKSKNKQDLKAIKQVLTDDYIIWSKKCRSDLNI